MLKTYLEEITETFNRGDAREESYYSAVERLMETFATERLKRKIAVTTLPKKTEAGNPDFRIWDGRQHIVGYIEAKDPTTKSLDAIEHTEQLKRYRSIFPNVLLTNFLEFRLYRDGDLIDQCTIAQSHIITKVNTTPPVQQEEAFMRLMGRFFDFRLPAIRSASRLAAELAKRTRFLRDEVVNIELAEEEKEGKKVLRGFYDAFHKYLIGTITETQFADLYSQTITYGLFAAKTRADKEFTRRLAFDYIPKTIGILRDVFRFISLEDPPKSLQVIVDDIAEVLQATDTKQILRQYFEEGKGTDPIIHFYETFLSKYDPSIREKRGVYYTPEPVVHYIVNSLHQILKDKFNMPDGFASEGVTVLDPAGGTLTFPVATIQKAVGEYEQKYGSGGKQGFIKKHILQNFYAFELMMAPYAIGHLKMGFMLDELGYHLEDDERFKLYLTNTLEMEDLAQVQIPGLSSLSEESHEAAKVKKDEPILVILGNPPYSGISSNINKWTEELMKQEVDGAQSYYEVDGKPLGEKKLWLQDDYVKFLRFAQWKIHKAGKGVVGMITNHSYLDNPTFRGMRQSLMHTFDEIHILNLHGNSLKKETTPEGGKDENVFDIRQGVAICLMIKTKPGKVDKTKLTYVDQWGLRQEKYNWLEKHELKNSKPKSIEPKSPWYFFIPRDTESIQQFLDWPSISKIFPVNISGIVTARDRFAIDFDNENLLRKVRMFQNLKMDDETIAQALDLKENYQWKISEQRKQFSKEKDLQNFIKRILYRPFDYRFIFYHDNIVFRTRKEVMKHMLHDNKGLILGKRFETSGEWEHVFISDALIQHHSMSLKEVNYIFPLYLYPTEQEKRKILGTSMMLFEPEEEYDVKRPNIAPELFKILTKVYGSQPRPDNVFYYIYAVLYSNTYRTKYAEFLKIGFPRIPFTAEKKLFLELAVLGERLAHIHLLKSSELDPPIAKYQGAGSDKVEKPVYNEKEQRVYINGDKYFEGVPPEVWNYQVGGYQVCHKYLKDRKGRTMDDPRHYVRIVTALAKTIEIQKEIDEKYKGVEEKLIEVSKGVTE